MERTPGAFSHLPSSPSAESVSSSSHLYPKSQLLAAARILKRPALSYKRNLRISRIFVCGGGLPGLVLKLSRLGRRRALRLVWRLGARHDVGSFHHCSRGLSDPDFVEVKMNANGCSQGPCMASEKRIRITPVLSRAHLEPIRTTEYELTTDPAGPHFPSLVVVQELRAPMLGGGTQI